MSPLRIRELVRKEFIQLFRDKRNRVLLFAAPLIQILVFGYVVNYDIRNIRVALLDFSRTQESRNLVADFTGSIPAPTSSIACSCPQSITPRDAANSSRRRITLHSNSTIA